MSQSGSSRYRYHPCSQSIVEARGQWDNTRKGEGRPAEMRVSGAPWAFETFEIPVKPALAGAAAEGGNRKRRESGIERPSMRRKTHIVPPALRTARHIAPRARGLLGPCSGRATHLHKAQYGKARNCRRYCGRRDCANLHVPPPLSKSHQRPKTSRDNCARRDALRYGSTGAASSRTSPQLASC